MSSQAPPEVLEVTEVRIRLAEGGPQDLLKAYASITIAGCLAVHNLKIIQGQRGLFVSMPARRNKAGGFSDIVHPIHQKFRTYLEDVVIGAYWREIGDAPEDGDGDLRE